VPKVLKSSNCSAVGDQVALDQALSCWNDSLDLSRQELLAAVARLAEGAPVDIEGRASRTGEHAVSAGAPGGAATEQIPAE
jgi:hypothetical protein